MKALSFLWISSTNLLRHSQFDYVIGVKVVLMCAHSNTEEYAHSRVGSHYSVLIGWNLNNAQAKQPLHAGVASL